MVSIEELGAESIYHSIVRLLVTLLVALAFGMRSSAQTLPDLGDVSQAVLSPAIERRIGESIMERLRADRSYHDDPVTTDYLNSLGNRLVLASPDSRQAFDFFLILDPTVNAFALPGGFIGVHAGLIQTAQTESELASVLAHEVAHVTQRHIARMIASQEKSSLVTLAALAIGILAARSNSQVGQALITGSQAAAIQSQLDFSRDNEREADRVGLQILDKAGFDIRSMPVFMERMQRASRHYENNAPNFLRTHPVTTERIADLQNRTEGAAYKQVPDNQVFQLVRARLRAMSDDPRESVPYFEQALKDRRFLNESATRYGLALALMRAKDFKRAKAELATLQRIMPDEPAIAALAGEILTAAFETQAALTHYKQALIAHPHYRALVYDYAEALIANRQPQAALKLVDAELQKSREDTRLYFLQAKSYAALGRRLLQHRAQAEAYVRRGQLGAAIEQLELAQRAGDGDFYQLSSVDARLRELRANMKTAERERR
jgi:predicted Zn-dependent protease